ncbi:hypothetical protein M514_13342 [Trichuris suis]|uniref:Uncharacterized protein n=1 Tax=Trichuris suis TaxID=68888 RepID=A0A085N0W7_9BILA|nr:hypothetical protein M513_13342 [Trichuris suis]KFD63113.1 hypothetical protein M514_13342 [Trichuris suis]
MDVWWHATLSNCHASQESQEFVISYGQLQMAWDDPRGSKFYQIPIETACREILLKCVKRTTI